MLITDEDLFQYFSLQKEFYYSVRYWNCNKLKLTIHKRTTNYKIGSFANQTGKVMWLYDIMTKIPISITNFLENKPKNISKPTIMVNIQ
jgi:hypothetical protein